MDVTEQPAVDVAAPNTDAIVHEVSPVARTFEAVKADIANAVKDLEARTAASKLASDARIAMEAVVADLHTELDGLKGKLAAFEAGVAADIERIRAAV